MKLGKLCCSVCGRLLPASTVGLVCPGCAFGGALAEGSAGPDTADNNQEPERGGQTPKDEAPAAFGPPRHFGNYELLEEIARGGMGIVYKARQKGLNRIVAVKLMVSGQLARPEVVQRFQTEAQTIAHLQHPNIVAIHEVGEHEGQHYFSMDYVEGQTLAAIVREGPMAATRAATYLESIAEAVHYAHQHGVLHRDLKPSNILIDSSDQPRVTDFGLAKWLTGDSELTLSGQVLGSPNYLSPEQAAGKHTEVGPASDVYALGAMLYHLLTGRPPFQADSLTTLLRQVMETEPVAPRLLNPSIPRDLETLCLKCLEKEPARRYPTAQALAEELSRFLRSEPIQARRVGRQEKAWRWCRRKPSLAAAIAAAAFVAALGLTGILWQWREAVMARTHAEHQRYDAAISGAQLLIEQNRFDRAREILAREDSGRDRGWEWGWLQRQCNLDFMTLNHLAPVICVAFSPDGRHLLTAGKDALARLWDLETGLAVRCFAGHRRQINAVAFSPDGQRVMTGSDDGTARVWDLATGRQVLKLANGDGVMDAAFSPDGSQIATAAVSQGLKLWNSQSGAALPIPAQHDQPVYCVAFSPNGRKLACAGGAWLYEGEADTTVSILDLTSGQRRSLKAHRRLIRCVRFSPDGKVLATASFDGTIRLWDLDTGAELRPLQTVFDFEVMFRVQFSPDGRWLAVAGPGWPIPRARVFEVATGRLARSLEGHSGIVADLAFNPDGSRLATASVDGAARVWSPAALPEFLSLEGHDATVWSVAFSADGKRLASGSLDQTARIWDAESGSSLATINAGFPVVSLAFSPDGGRLVTVGPDHSACIWTVPAKQESSNAPPGFGVRQSSGAFSRASRFGLGSKPTAPEDWRTPKPGGVASGLDGREASYSPKRLRGHTGTVMAVAWSADGRMIVTGSKDGTARLWDATTGGLLRTVPAHSNWVLSVAINCDGRRFATGSADNTARIWDVGSGRLLRELQRHQGWVQQVAFSPDGHRLATGSLDRKARLWDAETGHLLLTMEGHRSGVSSVAFSRDGTRLATAGGGADLSQVWAYDRSALIWDLHTGQRLLKLDAHSAWLVAVAFSPDGRRLATGNMDNTIRIRDAFPWNPEEYAALSGSSLADKMEAFKRRYWREQLRSASRATPLDAFVPPSTHRLERVIGSVEISLRVERGTKSWPTLPIPPREPQTAANCIDVTASYNSALGETWQPTHGLLDVDQNLASLPAGLTGRTGVPFDVRGVIRLSQRAWDYAIFPTRVEIPVGRSFRRMHVLHGAAGNALEGTQIGTYRLMYGDGSSSELKILYGHDVRNWLLSGDAIAPAAAAEVAWTGPADLTRPTETQACLYRRTYDNPAPEREVVRITFESTMTSAAPFLLALTVEP